MAARVAQARVASSGGTPCLAASIAGWSPNPDLRANKLTCILSRSEPRDLVDLYFLDRTGHPPEQDLDLAHRKDAGIDPGILAWLLSQFPTAPLPGMLEPLTSEELETFRRDLAERMRRIAVS